MDTDEKREFLNHPERWPFNGWAHACRVQRLASGSPINPECFGMVTFFPETSQYVLLVNGLDWELDTMKPQVTTVDDLLAAGWAVD